MDADHAEQLIESGALDLLDGDLYAGDPEPAYAALRANRPVYWDATNELWGVSRHRDIVAIEKDPATWSNAGGYRPNIPADPSMIGVDDPLHAERRRLVARRFTPRAVTEHETMVRDTVTALIVITLGGLGSALGALLGGFLLGLVEAFGMHFTSPSLKMLLSYAVFIGVLLVRPKGLFSR